MTNLSLGIATNIVVLLQVLDQQDFVGRVVSSGTIARWFKSRIWYT